MITFQTWLFMTDDAQGFWGKSRVTPSRMPSVLVKDLLKILCVQLQNTRHDEPTKSYHRYPQPHAALHTCIATLTLDALFTT